MSRPLEDVKDKPAASKDDRFVAIVANPYSGARRNLARVNALVKALSRKGIDAKVLWEPAEAHDMLIDRSLDKKCRCVVAAGGDGTVRQVIQYQPVVPIATMPLGNENLFARQYNFTRKPRELAQAIVDENLRQVDAARLGDKMFGVVASVGFDADVVHRVTAWRRQQAGLKRIRRMSYLRPFFRSLREYRYPQINIEADDDTNFGTHLLIFNLPRYACNFKFAPQAEDNDGYLDWVLFKRPGWAYLTRYLWAVMRNKVSHLPDALYGRSKRIRVLSRVPAPVQIDGEPAGFTPAEIEVLPGILRVVQTTGPRARDKVTPEPQRYSAP